MRSPTANACGPFQRQLSDINLTVSLHEIPDEFSQLFSKGGWALFIHEGLFGGEVPSFKTKIAFPDGTLFSHGEAGASPGYVAKPIEQGQVCLFIPKTHLATLYVPGIDDLSVVYEVSIRPHQDWSKYRTGSPIFSAMIRAPKD